MRRTASTTTPRRLSRSGVSLLPWRSRRSRRVPIEIFTGDAAYADIVGAPANIMLYGGPGTGKSTDAASAFVKDGRCTAFVIPCEKNALKPLPARGLPAPDHSGVVETWGGMTEAIGWLGQHRAHYNAVIIDGISALTSNLYKEAQETMKGKNKYDIPVAVRNCLFVLRQWVMQLGLHSIFIAHPKEPGFETSDNGQSVFYPGAPLLVPRSMIAVYWALVDTVLRVGHVYSALPNNLPQRVYFTGGNVWPEQLGMTYPPPGDWRQWWVKNREGVNLAVVPADLGAYLRARQPPYAGL